jgi:hypothetical protein
LHENDRSGPRNLSCGPLRALSVSIFNLTRNVHSRSLLKCGYLKFRIYFACKSSLNCATYR